MGKITGDVSATEKVKLLAPAALNGGVKTPMISIEDGVHFNGTLEMIEGVRQVSHGASPRAIEDPGVSVIKRTAA